MAHSWTLRPLAEDDLDLLLALDSDPEVMRYITGGRPTPRVTLAEAQLPRMLGAATRPGLGFFVVGLEGREVGWVHLRADSVNPKWAEVGYRLERAVWGRGLATSLCRGLVERAFALGFDVVSGRTLPENRASRRVLEKAGLVFAGDFVFPARELPGFSAPAMPGVLYLRSRGPRPDP